MCSSLCRRSRTSELYVQQRIPVINSTLIFHSETCLSRCLKHQQGVTGLLFLITLYSLDLQGKGGTDSPENSLCVLWWCCQGLWLCCLSLWELYGCAADLAMPGADVSGVSLFVASLDTCGARDWLQNMGQEVNVHR